MEPDAGSRDLDAFLSAHGPVEHASAYVPGEQFGDWRVTAFLGRGGSGEVYRVVHSTLGTAAALKVCVRSPDRDSARDAAVCVRFRREAELLSENRHPAFPRFLGFGERDGRPWYVMELLEYRPLPTAASEIARFLLAVAAGVRHLHSWGIIHRDIKPGNILWRRVGDAAQMEPVLVDLGLAKDLSAVRGHAGESLSIVDGLAVGVGTPRYAAPEQMSGDEVSPATDVYALGMLANDCFGGKPPRAWRRIIQRATAALPTQRYPTVDAFARAIRLVRIGHWGGRVICAALAVVAVVFGMHLILEAPSTTVVENKKSAWQSMCRNVTTNIVTRRFKMQFPDSVRRTPHGKSVTRDSNIERRLIVASWVETNKVNATMVNLGGRTVVFDEPLDLDAGREYWIVGPGVLDAQFSSASTAIVHVVNCIFRNRTKISPGRAGIDYVLDGGAYLNFTDLPSTKATKAEAGERIQINRMSEGWRWWKIKGPEDITELIEEEQSSSAYSATMKSFDD